MRFFNLDFLNTFSQPVNFKWDNIKMGENNNNYRSCAHWGHLEPTLWTHACFWNVDGSQNRQKKKSHWTCNLHTGRSRYLKHETQLVIYTCDLVFLDWSRRGLDSSPHNTPIYTRWMACQSHRTPCISGYMRLENCVLPNRDLKMKWIVHPYYCYLNT